MSTFMDKVLATCTKCSSKYLLPAMMFPKTYRHGDEYGLCTSCDSVVAVGKFNQEFLAELNVTQFDDGSPAFGVSSEPTETMHQVGEGKRRGRPKGAKNKKVHPAVPESPIDLEIITVQAQAEPEPIIVIEKSEEPAILVSSTTQQLTFSW